MSKILMAMSGGVDSTTAAMILKNQGHEIVGATLLLHDTESEGILRAKETAAQLGIDHVVLDKREYFKNTVVKNFTESYKKCITPNPCIYCNRNCKFQLLLEYAEEEGFDYVASGHYAKVEMSDNGRYVIRKGKDTSKDQSYVLYQLTQEQLSRIIMPLGDYTKEEIRQMARKAGFANAEAKESQDICFIPDGDYAAFIEKNEEDTAGPAFQPGDFVDRTGKVLGRHKGLVHYTIGQRKGLGLSLPAPMYVCAKIPQTNQVVLCDNDGLFKKDVVAGNVNLVCMDSINIPIRVSAKVRYSQHETMAMVLLVDDKLVVQFEEPVRAPAPGQSLVMYAGDIVVGGGIIE
ncbi:MAG: tRNA 2-thiouridine(34) synthase MnmA [Lachnospiraceae bacterium]|nr:tRNA 2-thiouridine(34) synthase MnmA [Lachnospiraceae bacterium]